MAFQGSAPAPGPGWGQLWVPRYPHRAWGGLRHLGAAAPTPPSSSVPITPASGLHSLSAPQPVLGLQGPPPAAREGGFVFGGSTPLPPAVTQHRKHPPTQHPAPAQPLTALPTPAQTPPAPTQHPHPTSPHNRHPPPQHPPRAEPAACGWTGVPGAGPGGTRGRTGAADAARGLWLYVGLCPVPGVFPAPFPVPQGCASSRCRSRCHSRCHSRGPHPAPRSPGLSPVPFVAPEAVPGAIPGAGGRTPLPLPAPQGRAGARWRSRCRYLCACRCTCP